MLIDCLQVFRAICRAESVFAMLSRSKFKILGVGIKMNWSVLLSKSYMNAVKYHFLEI